MEFLLLTSLLALSAILTPQAFARVPGQDSRPARPPAEPWNRARNARLPDGDPEEEAPRRCASRGVRDVVLPTEYDWIILAVVLLAVILFLTIVL
jgi:hypothetical protein